MLVQGAAQFSRLAMPTLLRWTYSGSHSEHHAEQRVFAGEVEVDKGAPGPSMAPAPVPVP